MKKLFLYIAILSAILSTTNLIISTPQAGKKQTKTSSSKNIQTYWKSVKKTAPIVLISCTGLALCAYLSPSELLCHIGHTLFPNYVSQECLSIVDQRNDAIEKACSSEVINPDYKIHKWLC